ncbi:MAG: hypothetical protein Q9204_004293 [Flavoplaca sp. TL-2023a]
MAYKLNIIRITNTTTTTTITKALLVRLQIYHQFYRLKAEKPPPAPHPDRRSLTSYSNAATISKPLKSKLADQWDRVRLLGRKLKIKITHPGEKQEVVWAPAPEDGRWGTQPVREEEDGVDWERKEVREDL